MSKHIMTKVAAVLAISSLGVLSLAGSASAAPPGTSETINEGWSSSFFPPAPPFFATYTGTFTASGAFGDSGTVTVNEVFAAVPAPSVSVTQQVQTLAGTQGTLTLQCTLFANDFSNPADIPSTGTCAVLSGTGPYASLSGSGKMTGYYNDTLPSHTAFETVVIPAR